MKKIILLLLITTLIGCEEKDPCKNCPQTRVATEKAKCEAPLFVVDSAGYLFNTSIFCQRIGTKHLVDIHQITDIDRRVAWLRHNDSTSIDFVASEAAIIKAHLLQQVPQSGIYYNIRLSKMKEMAGASPFKNSYDQFLKVWIENDKVKVAAVNDFTTSNYLYSFPFILAAAKVYGDGTDPEFGFMERDGHMYIRMIKSGTPDVYFNISTDPAFIKK